MDEQTRLFAMMWLLAGIALMFAVIAIVFDARAMDDSGRIDNAIIFVADVSKSMNDREIEIVRGSHAASIQSDEVISAIRSGAFQRSAFAYIEFAETAEVVVGWTLIDSAEAATGFAQAILEPRGDLGASTHIGNGLAAAEGLLRALPWKPLYMTVDVAGDGVSNGGIPISIPRQLILDMGATINGLPMEMQSFNSGLSDWYRDFVIGGPRAFLLPLNRIDDMPTLLRRKIIMEVG